MWILYTLSIQLLRGIVIPVSLFNKKAREWRKGRKNWKEKLQKDLNKIKNPIWVHCSSLGEFEQGRPVIEALREQGESIVLTFFSPSGYSHRKNYGFVDYVTYIPIDTPDNADQFLSIVQPKAILFIKYEFWFNFIRKAHKRRIPMFLVSGIFRKNQYFFKPWGITFRMQLKKFNTIFVQNEDSQTLLEGIGLNNVILSGDTRFDRVIRVKELKEKDKVVEPFIESLYIIVAGSTWPEDEKLLLKLAADPGFDGQIIIAPHEVSEERITSIVNKCTFPICLYTNGIENEAFAKMMIVDKVGVLSNIYQYGQVAYIGGGFGKGIHNILEAAVFGIPVVFGPNFEKFAEARDLVRSGGAVSVNRFLDFSQIIHRFRNDENIRSQCGMINRDYVNDNKGATETVMNALKEKNIIR